MDDLGGYNTTILFEANQGKIKTQRATRGGRANMYVHMGGRNEN